MNWQPIETAPRDGTPIYGLAGVLAQRTWFGKTAHVPLYGWCFLTDPPDVESCDLWSPSHWMPEPPK
jgi:hypothetical protein